jgi:hypothetical protein
MSEATAAPAGFTRSFALDKSNPSGIACEITASVHETSVFVLRFSFLLAGQIVN